MAKVLHQSILPEDSEEIIKGLNIDENLKIENDFSSEAKNSIIDDICFELVSESKRLEASIEKIRNDKQYNSEI